MSGTVEGPSIRELASAARAAMDARDAARTEKLLAQLRERLGDNNLLVLRMRAYWAMSRHRDSSARLLIGRILSLRPHDLRSGVNMALLDWRAGRRIEAVRRLKELRDEHPDSRLVGRYLAAMEAAGG